MVRDRLGGTALYALYRFVCLVSGNLELPLGCGVGIEAALVPVLMALGDGVLMAWVIVELRNAGLGDDEAERLDVAGLTVLIPAASLACVLAFPARYVGAGAWLALQYLPVGLGTGNWASSLLRWQLGSGLVDLQGVAVVTSGLMGAVAWSQGTWADSIHGYLRLLGQEGGRLVASVAIAGVTVGALSAVAYLIVLSLPTSTWALNAADSYAHYTSMPIGLLLLAAMIELGERSLPLATPAQVNDEVV